LRVRLERKDISRALKEAGIPAVLPVLGQIFWLFQPKILQFKIKMLPFNISLKVPSPQIGSA
jgi:hypothetical protein